MYDIAWIESTEGLLISTPLCLQAACDAEVRGTAAGAADSAWLQEAETAAERRTAHGFGSDLLHMHLALAGTLFNHFHIMFMFYIRILYLYWYYVLDSRQLSTARMLTSNCMPQV